MVTVSQFLRREKITAIELFYDAWYWSHIGKAPDVEVFKDMDRYYKYGTVTEYVRNYINEPTN